MSTDEIEALRAELKELRSVVGGMAEGLALVMRTAITTSNPLALTVVQLDPACLQLHDMLREFAEDVRASAKEEP